MKRMNRLEAKALLKIDQQRKKIDLVDQKIAHLCGRRAQLAHEILQIKKQNAIHMIDQKREQQIIISYKKILKSKKSVQTNHFCIQPQKIKKFVKALLELSQNYKKRSVL